MNASPKLLDGRWLAGVVEREIAQEVKSLAAKYGRAPGLGVILVGANPASQAYVGNKEKIAKRCGLNTFDFRFPEEASFEQVEAAVQAFNNDQKVDGILLQLPLPTQLASRQNVLLDAISPAKDADGLHPENQGLLMRGEGGLRSCTPLGAMKLIDLAYSSVEIGSEAVQFSQIGAADLSGKRAIVIGRSILVGKPLALLLLARNATVTMAHSKSPKLADLTAQADIVIAAVGRPGLVRGGWIKPGAVVIDVGINRTQDGKLTGDVAYDEAAPHCAAITPVPGGVGPMTVVMLVYNTLQAFRIRIKE
jgi:methylenetetrahydrofolate dehydrogenase (NADP+) / methenyltetrahydrofolate cyclohydrolase